MTWELAVEESRRRLEEIDARSHRFLRAIADRKALRLVSAERPGYWLIVSPSITEDGYRVTYGQSEPHGHYEFKSREAAVRACAGESHTKLVPGPPYFAFGPFVPEKGGAR